MDRQHKDSLYFYIIHVVSLIRKGQGYAHEYTITSYHITAQLRHMNLKVK